MNVRELIARQSSGTRLLTSPKNAQGTVKKSLFQNNSRGVFLVFKNAKTGKIPREPPSLTGGHCVQTQAVAIRIKSRLSAISAYRKQNFQFRRSPHGRKHNPCRLVFLYAAQQHDDLAGQRLPRSGFGLRLARKIRALRI